MFRGVVWLQVFFFLLFFFFGGGGGVVWGQMFLDVGLSFVLGSYDAMHYYQKKKKKKANKGKLS